MKQGTFVITKDGQGEIWKTSIPDIYSNKGRTVCVHYGNGTVDYYKEGEVKKVTRLILPPDPPPRKIFEVGDIVKTPEGVGSVTGYYGTVMGEYSSNPPPDANDETETDRERIFYDVDIDGIEHSFIGSRMSELTVEEWQEWQNRSQEDSEKELTLSGSSK